MIIYDTRFGIEIFVLAETDEFDNEIKNKVHKIIQINELNEEEFSKELK